MNQNSNDMRHFKITSITVLLSVILAFPAQSLADIIAARDTVTGTVVGKNKEPLPGAKVEIVGQPYSTFTDLDGRFNIKCDPKAKKVRVSYPKAPTVSRKITPDMTVRMGRTWRNIPERYQWFLGVNFGAMYVETDIYHAWTQPGANGYGDTYTPYYNYFTLPEFSIMVGRVKAVGWYAKYYVTTVAKGTDWGDSYKANSLGAVLGGMVRLGCPLHLYIGIGYNHTLLHNVPSYTYKRSGYVMEGGFLFRINDHYGININGHAGDSEGLYYYSGSIGFNYFFNK